MKQILQNIANGETNLVDVPCPQAKKGEVLIQSSRTLVSVGTERMLIDFGKSGWVQKARSQPDKVRMVLDKVKTDGLVPTIEAVKSKLDQPLSLGYCNVGTVMDHGSTDLEIGQRVVSNGNHAEVVRVPKNLVAKIPDGVSDETASFTVLAAIALQGIRLVKPTIGETVVVTGLGLIGLLAVQILRANGCRVVGIDFESAKCDLARQYGAEVVDLSKNENALEIANTYSRGNGVDAVLITASSDSDEIVKQAATMCRKRGRIVLVGVVGLELSRADFFEKELIFQVSCSYGPGRYDIEYENKGNDYPLGFVRWTEQRNFEAVLDLMSTNSINADLLISHKFSINEAKAAYQKLDNKNSLGIILEYENKNQSELKNNTVTLKGNDGEISIKQNSANVAFIGAGNYASRVLIPAFKKAGAGLVSVVSSGGVSAMHHGSKNGFSEASTDIQTALSSKVDVVVIATQHNLHAKQALLAINSEKHVFVEKPLALTMNEIAELEMALKAKNNNTKLMVGYNRRFSPFVKKAKELLSATKSSKVFVMTMNAGEIPSDHWTQSREIGGGRIIGEACHYIDLMRYFAASKIKSFHAEKIGDPDGVQITEDKALITLTFEDGSIGSIHYLANGGKAFPKERIEIFCDNAVLQIDNFKSLIGYGWSGFKKMSTWKQNKGQEQCTKEFIDSVKNDTECPIPLDEIFEVSKISVQIAEALR